MCSGCRWLKAPSNAKEVSPVDDKAWPLIFNRRSPGLKPASAAGELGRTASTSGSAFGLPLSVKPYICPRSSWAR